VSSATARAHQAEGELARLRAQPSPASLAPVSTTPAAPARDDDPEPDIESFSKADDPFKAFMREHGKWAARQERKSYEETQRQADARALEADADQDFRSRFSSYAAAHPDFAATLQRPEAQIDLPPVMMQVIRTHESGPAMAYYLATHPDETRSLALFSRTVPADAASLREMGALLQSRLTAAAPTGSASVAGRSTAPRPITPVRTGRVSRDDGPPDPATSSLDEHFAHYNQQGNGLRRRRP
jgi:hypothetical protein